MPELELTDSQWLKWKIETTGDLFMMDGGREISKNLNDALLAIHSGPLGPHIMKVTVMAQLLPYITTITYRDGREWKETMFEHNLDPLIKVEMNAAFKRHTYVQYMVVRDLLHQLIVNFGMTKLEITPR